MNKIILASLIVLLIGMIILFWNCDSLNMKFWPIVTLILGSTALLTYMTMRQSNAVMGGNAKDTSSKLRYEGSWRINVITTNPDILQACEGLEDIYRVNRYNTYPDRNTPALITITDIIPDSEIPSSYIILCGSDVSEELPSRIIKLEDLSDLKKLCAKLAAGGNEPPPKTITKYNVGEHIFTGKSPTKNTLNYDDSYDIWVDKRDTLVKESAIKGVPYEKYMTACLSSFIPPNTTILDVGTNIGTVSLPLSRLHNSLVNVVSFEPLPTTHSILFKNIIENDARNITPIKITVGDKNRQNITLSDKAIILPHYTDKTGVAKISHIKSQDEDTEIHFGAVHLGKGMTITSMTTIDELKLDISAMKVDVEGAEQLVFYGARETIKRCMPVIVFEHNENVLSGEMIDMLGIGPEDEVLSFDILKYCHSLGYRDFYELDIQDYMLVPPGMKQIEIDSIAKFRPIRRMKEFSHDQIKMFNLFKFVRPRWQ